jgi:pSer/pThr/pTyr-binding forkhead associated (FHA) protein
MQAVLVMFRNDGERRSFSLSRETTIIGRRQDCDLMIPLGEISRKHCKIIRDGDDLRLEDLGSSNGTFYNGKRVQETTLHAGDTISVGPINFVVQIDGVPSEDEAEPNAGGVAAAHAHLGADDEEPEVVALGAEEDDEGVIALGDDDELERTPATELDEPAADDDAAMPLADSGELQPLAIDEDEDDDALTPAPTAGRSGKHEDNDDALGALGDEEQAKVDDLDAELDKLELLDDSTANEITLDDETPKRGRH